jgi:hypothetical protein
MKRIGAVAVFLAAAAVVPAMAFAQGAVGAWCGGSYGAGGTSFGQCVDVQAGAVVAGQASGISERTASTVPEYPANEVTFNSGKAFFRNQELNLNYVPSADRSREIQAGDGGGTD